MPICQLYTQGPTAKFQSPSTIWALHLPFYIIYVPVAKYIALSPFSDLCQTRPLNHTTKRSPSFHPPLPFAARWLTKNFCGIPDFHPRPTPARPRAYGRRRSDTRAVNFRSILPGMYGLLGKGVLGRRGSVEESVDMGLNIVACWKVAK